MGSVNTKDILMLPVSQIYQHPDNPRKELGDLDELAESIIANGIMQNLTVVTRPNGGYTAIIGHRRLAAARRAGLELVPCVIAELTPEEQVGIMLAENMMRANLSIYEQAKGFQMMLDMGATVEDIRKMSGFSESTVRRRAKLAELDGEGLKFACSMGASLFDLEDIQKIEDENKRRELLKGADKREFRYNIERALAEQKQTKEYDRIERIISSWATKTTHPGVLPNGEPKRMNWHDNVTASKKTDRPDDAKPGTYFYVRNNSGIFIYKTYEELPADQKWKREKEEREARRAESDAKINRLRAIDKEDFLRRKEFIENFRDYDRKRDEVIELAFSALVESKGYMSDEMRVEIGRMIGAPYDEEMEEFNYRKKIDAFVENPLRPLLIAAWRMADRGQGYWKTRWGTNGCMEVFPEQSKSKDSMYAILCRMGYRMSVNETSMQKGDLDNLIDPEPVTEE